MSAFTDPKVKKQNFEILYKQSKNYYDAFTNFTSEVLKDNVLSNKTKELICVALATSKRCKGCMEAHLPKAKAAGCTKEEILEAALVATCLNGGPAFSTIIGSIIPMLEELFEK